MVFCITDGILDFKKYSISLKSITIVWLLLIDDRGSTYASADFIIGDENLNIGWPVLFEEVISSCFPNY